jgi:hypothetical protein
MYKQMTPFYTLAALLVLMYLVFATWCLVTRTAA